jgi:hypothetical protein
MGPCSLFQDDFNLTGLNVLVPYYDYALDMVLDVEMPMEDSLTEEQQEIVESAAVCHELAVCLLLWRVTMLYNLSFLCLSLLGGIGNAIWFNSCSVSEATSWP